MSAKIYLDIVIQVLLWIVSATSFLEKGIIQGLT